MAGVPADQCAEDRYHALWGFARRLERELTKSQEALLDLFQATKNEMVARGLPVEWQADSPMGRAAALLTKTVEPPKITQRADLIARLYECRRMVGNMCSEGRPPKMSIPARVDVDEDIVICRTISEAVVALGGTVKPDIP